MAQQQQQSTQQPVHSKMNFEGRSRDIRRRIDVIQKKIADLQELGVPCAFTYTSARNTGSIFTVGDSRVTDVIEHHKNEILKNLMDGDVADDGHSTNEIHMILPPLPAPLNELNRTSLKTLITGILKDLGLRWTDPRPNWWPPDVPFVPPRSTPENFSGSWTQALRRVLESVYSYFSYDVNTYVATKLDAWTTRSPNTTEAAATVNEPLDATHSGDSSIENGPSGHVLRGSTSSSEESTISRSFSDRVANCDSPLQDDSKFESGSAQRKLPEAAATVNEPLDATNSGDSSVENRSSGHVLHGSTSSSEESTISRSSSDRIANCDSPLQDDSKSESSFAQRKLPNKSISSFTVENILMKRQRSSSSSDSPTTTIGSFSTPPPSNNSSSTSTVSNSHSSVVGTNWVSHPPVKYTKFTMLSPTSMADETQRKKRTDGVIELQWRDQGGKELGLTSSSPSTSSSSDQVHDLKRTPSTLRGSLVDLSTSFPVTQKPKSFSRSSSSGTPTSYFHKGNTSSDPQPQAFPTTPSIFQTAAKMSALPVVQAIPTATDVKAAVLHQTFPASGQQVVLLIPSNTTSITGSIPTVFYTNPVLSIGQSTSSPSAPCSSSGGATKHVTAASVSPSIICSTSGAAQSGEEQRMSTLSSHMQRHAVIDRATTPPHDQSESYRPIAPKTAAESALRESRDGKSNDRMKLYLKRTMPKPPKLRFHMTTVMKQPAGNTVMTSLTAQSPQAISGESSAPNSDRGPLSAAAVSENEQHLRSEVAVESTIRRSPNIYSNESSTGQKQFTAATSMQWTKQDTDSSGSSPTSAHGSPKPSCTIAVGNNSTSKNGSITSSSNSQTTVLKDSGFHLQLVKQQGRGAGGAGDTNSRTQQNSKDQDGSGEFGLVQKSARQNGRQQPGPGRGRGRATRSYTRRKRELTFHLYEDPSTAFRAKRQCRDKEPQH